MVPYSVQASSSDNGRDIAYSLAAAELIDSYLKQPAYRRHATMRFDVWDGQGVLPCPLHNITEVRVNGETTAASEYGISGGVFQFAGTRPFRREPTRHLVEIDGVMGFGSVTGLSDLTYSAGTLTAAAEANVLPLGSILYNNGVPVYVESIDELVMKLSGILIDEDDPQLFTPPRLIRRASDAIRQDLALASSTGDINTAPQTASELIPAQVRQMLAPFSAVQGGVSSHTVLTGGTPSFPQEGGAFGPGFGRGFD